MLVSTQPVETYWNMFRSKYNDIVSVTFDVSDDMKHYSSVAVRSEKNKRSGLVLSQMERISKKMGSDQAK